MVQQARYYNLTTRQSTALNNPYEENALIAQYTASEVENTANNNTMLYTSSAQGDSYNDVTFPLPTYPATLGVEEYDRLVALEHFDKRYAGSGECDGFAKYAHDAFWHILIDDRTQPSWVVNGTLTDDVYGNIIMEASDDCALVWREKDYDEVKNDENYVDNTAVVTQFFRALDRGSFVRYGKANDDTIWDGSHSIVFDGLSDDGAGIIVYEANQDWNNGVGYQKYYFDTIHNGYEWILYYVEHSVGEVVGCENEETHKLYCDNCDGYLRREHTAEYPTYHNYTLEEHIIEFDCCDGGIVEEHVFNGATEYSDETYHSTMCSFCDGFTLEEHNAESKYYSSLGMDQHSVYFECCGGVYAEDHDGSKTYTPLDINQHSVHLSCCGEVYTEDHYVHNYRCLDCGLSMVDPGDPGTNRSTNDAQQ